MKLSNDVQAEEKITLFEKVVRDYNNGITDYREIAEKNGIALGTSATYLTRAKKQGLLNVKNNTYNKVIQLYKEGIKDIEVIAEQLGKKKSTIEKYIEKARTEGLLEKRQTLYERFIILYNSGVTNHRELAKILEVELGTIKKYAIRAKKEGKTHKKSMYEKVIEIYNSGIRKPSDIAEKVNRSKALVYTYTEKAKKEGRLIDKDESKLTSKKISENDEADVKKSENGDAKKVENEDAKKVENGDAKNTEKSDGLTSLERNIKIRFEKGTYPRDIASQLGISSKRVYDFLERIDKEEFRMMRLKRISKNLLFERLKTAIESEDINQEEYLKRLKGTITNPKEIISLARIYYAFDNFEEAEKTLDSYIRTYREKYDILANVVEEREKIHLERLAMDIRNTYRNGRNMDETHKSYDDLCKDFNVRIRFVIDVLGKEPIERNI